MSKVIQLPVRKHTHELGRHFPAPGVIEHFPSNRAINWTHRISGGVLILSLVALAIKLF